MKAREPAFPSESSDSFESHPGMSLRDYFAGQVLAGAIGGETDHHDDILARRCYEIADAMLAERDKAES